MEMLCLHWLEVVPCVCVCVCACVCANAERAFARVRAVVCKRAVEARWITIRRLYLQSMS